MNAQMLLGKVAIVTGGASGIGYAISELFAEEGAAVIIADRNEHALNNAVNRIINKGQKAFGVLADISNKEDTSKVFNAALAQFGDVDILINNAGIGEQNTIDETSDELFEQILDVNLAAPMRYIREALKIFLPKNDGVIINITSVNGERPFGGASYTSSKGALNTLTRNIAMRLNDTNIRCNAVAPGATTTPMHLAYKENKQPGGQKMLEHSQHYVYFPGPECDPIDQAYACLYLASKMGKAVKGQIIQVCNGAFL